MGYLLGLILLAFLLLVESLIFSLYFVLRVAWRVKRHLLDPRTWFTLLVFFTLSFLILFFIQILLDGGSYLLTGRPFLLIIPFLPITFNIFLSSLVVALLYLLFGVELVSFFMGMSPAYNKDVVSAIRGFGREHLVLRVKTTAILLLILTLLFLPLLL